MEISAQTRTLRLKWHAAFARLQGKAAQLSQAFKAGFDPSQPRVPAGSPDGGQWTSTGGSSGGAGRRRRATSRDEGRVISDANRDNLQKPGAAGAKRPARWEIDDPVRPTGIQRHAEAGR